MTFEEQMMDIMFEKGVPMVPNWKVGDLNPYVEWMKWLSYVPEFQVTRIQEIESKTIKDCSLEELDIIREYRHQARMLGLFRNYGTAEITKEEYAEVYEFMETQSIEEVMLSKLSREELKSARDKIQHLIAMPNEELRKKIKEDQEEENYEKLSMVDAYILHKLARVDFTRSTIELNRDLKALADENDAIHKSTFYNITKHI